MGWCVTPDGHPQRPLDCLWDEGRIRRNKEKRVRVWRSKPRTEQRSAEGSWQEETPSWSPPQCPAMSDCEGPPTGEQKESAYSCAYILFGVHTCAHSVGVTVFVSWFGSLYGLQARGSIWSREGWRSRCAHLRCAQGWRSSPERKCGWVWPGCSSYVGVNCIKMCGVCVQVCVRVSERSREPDFFSTRPFGPGSVSPPQNHAHL